MRTKQVIQLHTVNKLAAFVWPLLYMVFSLVLVLIVGSFVLAVAGQAGEADLADARAGMNMGMQWNGAIFALLGPLIGFGFTAMGQYFPLALGLGLTRREFAVGTSAVFVGMAAFFAVIITIGKVIEVATSGFGLGIRFFDVHFTGIGPWWHTLIQTFLLILMVSLVGAAITAAFHRWGQSFLWTFWLTLAVIVVAVVGLTMLSEPFQGFVTGMFGWPWAGWMAVVTGFALVGGACWIALMRRAQAR